MAIRRTVSAVGGYAGLPFDVVERRANRAACHPGVLLGSTVGEPQDPVARLQLLLGDVGRVTAESNWQCRGAAQRPHPLDRRYGTGPTMQAP